MFCPRLAAYGRPEPRVDYVFSLLHRDRISARKLRYYCRLYCYRTNMYIHVVYRSILLFCSGRVLIHFHGWTPTHWRDQQTHDLSDEALPPLTCCPRLSDCPSQKCPSQKSSGLPVSILSCPRRSFFGPRVLDETSMLSSLYCMYSVR